MGNEIKKKKNLVVIFFGDGATEEGVFQESLDFASLHNLPVLFVCENNDFSVYSHLNKRQSKKRNILKLANSIGINGTRLPGNDVLKIYSASKKIIKYIKKNSKPHLLLLHTFRHLEHCGPNNDDHLGYRSKKYIKKWINNCPIKKMRNKIKTKKYLTNQEFFNYEKIIKKEIDSAFKFSKNSKFPSKKLLFEHIYAK